MKVVPIYDRLLVLYREPERMTAGGIVLPDARAEKQMDGTVVAIGDGHVMPDGSVRPLRCKVGDEVLFNKYAGVEVEVDKVWHVMLREEDVLGIIDRSAASGTVLSKPKSERKRKGGGPSMKDCRPAGKEVVA